MAVLITDIEKNSAAEKADIRKDDTIVSINGNEINDVLDYQFYASDIELSIEILREGIPYSVKIRKPQYKDLGLEFKTYLMDEKRRCCNNCIFCFIDQNPKGMRESIYFKDDDDRLSFLFGNYITLTNLSDHDVDRIIKMKISPINVSVHTTNPELRCKMMHNRFAGKSLEKLFKIARAGNKINAQIVLCPGINDGDELRKTLTDLETLYPAVQSVACVPVGITRYRDGLFPMDTYDEKRAGETIDIIHEFQEKFREKDGKRICYPSDEFFILAKRELPGPDYYDGFDQLDNGVGLISFLFEEFNSFLPVMEPLHKKRKFTAVTGEAAYPYIKELMAKLREKDELLDIEAVPIKNNFFGGKITVAGLVTGTDIADQLKGRDIGDALIVPDCMLRHEKDKFLDDMTLEELEEKVGVPVRVIGSDGSSMCEILEMEV